MTSFWQGSLRQSLESKYSLAGSQEEDRVEYTETVVSSVELLCFQPRQIQASIFISKSPYHKEVKQTGPEPVTPACLSAFRTTGVLALESGKAKGEPVL